MLLEKKNTAGIDSISIVDTRDTAFDSFTIEGWEIDVLGMETVPKLVDAAGLCVCLQGDAEIALDGRSYHFKKGDLCVLLPHTILQISRKSKDFKGYTLAGTSEFVHNINIPSSTAIYLYIKENPCISLSRDEQQMLLSLCDMIKEKDMRKGHLFRYEITEMLLLTLCYEIVAIYQKGKPLERQSYSRKSTLFIRFQHLIASHYHTHRNVEFYAEQLFITPRYLSAITKDISGMTAAECIIRVVIINARLLLSTTKLTIQQISDQLNFPNPSFFSQYFKKNTGMTPKEFRDQY
ncbi:AraC family transcriptional activator of pobA [Parabacteroides sp. PF5-5]|uniref:helix-turn-helix domain-containing protein n=1 Tax=unclassified Parabacteroides TaxID=2649774 RepID=UPI002474DA76|nr:MULTISPECIES: helix-turn-helix domain-containing protein [unclassified Parabacteroides]MDH6305685.1 AraC family transcriptional activator of pobA [Parabacteroides sp. PH5-39]MDH6316757.1 AraC family transcriptional activator of pobA [Parabacteroides sp. PF5-13]MDH6320398.1 AraC family transcriptional activator of pobA [Parabacteroides sp. PH5-13]MDH6324128.1 AraC family transcriptional activator of pobA [Parabacteroides sp. PH5-8]MDH6327943.1 AraC family transcriptional activator of pobA [P